MQHPNEDSPATSELSSGAAQPPAGASAVPDLSNRGTAKYGILRFGIDSLYLSFKGKLDTGMASQLSQAKKHAQSPDDAYQALAQIFIEDRVFRVSSRGSGLFSYVITDDDYRIHLAGRDANRIPLAYVQIASHTLTSIGVRQAVSVLESIVRQFGRVDGPIAVSRIDLFADFVSPDPLDSWTSDAWVTRARLIDTHQVGKVFSGWSIGRGGDLSARLYDKTLEIIKSKKDYLIPLWINAGWKGDGVVLRHEIQFRREVLRSLDRYQYPAILDHLGELWQYANGDWLRLTVPQSGDINKSRWPNHPLWDALLSIQWGDAVAVPLHRLKPITRIPGDARAYSALFSVLSSFMAAKSVDDPTQAMVRLFDEMRQHFDDVYHFKGYDFIQGILERAARKANEYGVYFPGFTEKAQEEGVNAAAKAYEKIKGK